MATKPLLPLCLFHCNFSLSLPLKNPNNSFSLPRSTSMEFWGAEVKAGTPLKVTPEEDNLIHISQATLDCKGKMTESVVLSVTVDKKKLVIGTLSQDKFPQISFDLVFEKEFELSHNCTKGNVHFIGYRSPNIEQDEGDFDSSEEEEDVPEAVPAVAPAAVAANGNAGAAAVVKADSKPKAKPAEVQPESEDDEEDSDEEDSSDDGDDSEKGMDVDEDDSDDEEDSEDEEEEETPKKPVPINKKRQNESASKTPVSGKKAKQAAAPAATPQKTEEKKKGGHTATPHPAKKGGKSPVNANQSPKSGGQSSGGNNKKPFNSGKQFGGSNKGSNKGKGKGRA